MRTMIRVSAVGVFAAAAMAGPAAAAPSNLELPTPQEDSSVLRLTDPQRWTARLRLELSAYQGIAVGNPNDYTLDRWVFDSLAVVLPVIDTTASAISVSEEVVGSLTIDDRVLDTEPEIIGPYHSQAMYARWDAPQGTARTLRLEQQSDLVTYETVYDDRAAEALEWPAEWGPEMEPYLAPDLFTATDASAVPEGTPSPVGTLLTSWTEGKDPKAVRPAVLAKFLAGKVQEHVRTVVNSQSNARTGRGGTLERTQPGLLTGLRVRPADDVAYTAEGTKHDMAVLLAALYRKAGLPCRIVIGYRERDSQRGGRRVPAGDQVRSWVEFALWLPEQKRVAWIPVDIAELRSRSSRMQSLDRPWKFFGTHDELDDIVPLAMHFHPPTTVRAFDNALIYGLILQPQTPAVGDQILDLNIERTPITQDTRDRFRPQPPTGP